MCENLFHVYFFINISGIWHRGSARDERKIKKQIQNKKKKIVRLPTTWDEQSGSGWNLYKNIMQQKLVDFHIPLLCFLQLPFVFYPVDTWKKKKKNDEAGPGDPSPNNNQICS